MKPWMPVAVTAAFAVIAMYVTDGLAYGHWGPDAFVAAVAVFSFLAGRRSK
jgi:hypothetical protein